MALRRRPPAVCISVKEPGRAGAKEERKQLGQKLGCRTRACEQVRCWDWQTGGVNSRNPAVRWAPPTAALWTGSASKTHILKTSFSAHAGTLEGAGKFGGGAQAEEVDH